jgi:hypothetical protein
MQIGIKRETFDPDPDTHSREKLDRVNPDRQ